MLTEPASYPRRRDVRGGATADDAPPPPGPERRRPEEPSLIRAADDARGRHATGRGDGFGRLVALTVLGAAVPGLGLVVAGRRRWGWAVLLPVLFVVAGAVAVVASGRGLQVVRQYAFAPRVMLGLAVGAVLVALLWCVVIVASHLALRRERLTGGQRLLSVLLVTALMGLVALPSATAARYAMTNRALLLSVFGGASAAGGPDTSGADPWAGIPRANVLLVGADSSQGHIGTRPDTVMVASIDTKTGNTVLLGLPRQLNLSALTFPGHAALTSAWQRGCAANGGAEGCFLNATYLFGVQHPELFPGAHDPGLEATRAAASGITGLTIDHEAMINLDGFMHLVDAMGGITLTVPKPIDIGGGQILGRNGRPTGRDYPVTGHVPAGKDEHLSGYYAEWYVRSRWPLSTTNNERMARQRCFVNAAVHQYGAVDLARAFPALAASAEQDFTTNITAGQLNAFIDLGLKVKDGSLRSLSFDSDNTSTGHPDYARLQGLVRQALVPPALPAPAAASSTPSGTASAAPAPTSAADPGAAVDADTACAS